MVVNMLLATSFELKDVFELRFDDPCDFFKIKCCDSGEVNFEEACAILSETNPNLVDMTWTRGETDQYFDLCERFDLRFILIADRLPSSWPVEEPKSCYAVSWAFGVTRDPTSGDVSGNCLLKEPEIGHKHILLMVLSQLKQEHKDAEVLAEVQGITEARGIAKIGETPLDGKYLAVKISRSQKWQSHCQNSSKPLIDPKVETVAGADLVCF